MRNAPRLRHFLQAWTPLIDQAGDDGARIMAEGGTLSAISIHIYGANSGAVRRHLYDRDTGRQSVFVSGDANHVMPTIWDRSAQSSALP